MRFFIGGPRVLGLRTGVILGASDFRSKPPPLPTPVNYIYVIQSATGAVKVGITTCPHARIAQLRTGSHTDLDFVALSACSGKAAEIERQAHAMLGNHRLKGEWFDIPPDTALDAVNRAAERLGQTLRPVDPSRPIPPPLPGSTLTPADRQLAHQNMLIFALALIAGIAAGAWVWIHF